MEAKHSSLPAFINKRDTRFIIPVYQRNYSWETKQCKQLLQDIVVAGENEATISHFVGSIVYIQNSVYFASGVNELTIIDGQQRLTTLMLLLLALSEKFKGIDDKYSQKIIKDFIINEDDNENEKIKLRPVKKDDLALKSIIDNTPFSEYSPIIENYNFLKNKLENIDLEIVRKGFAKLFFIEISLERGKDDPQRIFESLNSTGLDLTQADLIRNYILMDLQSEKQQKLYDKYWRLIEDYTTVNNATTRISEFMRNFISLKFNENPKEKQVFEAFKKYYPLQSHKTEDILEEICEYAGYYEKFINPDKETNKTLKKHFKEIQQLDVNVVYPFLLNVYKDYAKKIIDLVTFDKVLSLMQSFIWRRFICDAPTNALDKIFQSLYIGIDKQNYVGFLEKALLQKQRQQRFPNNVEVATEIAKKDIYNSKSKNRRYFLEKLENFNNTELVTIEGNDNITIEHILPQNPSKNWELTKEEIETLQQKYLHTIANLTLSGNNGELSNKTFLEKRNMPEKGYTASRLFLNKYLAEIDKWDETEILKRLETITKRFFEIWKFPEISLKNIAKVQNTSEINIFDLDDITNQKLEYAIFDNQKIANVDSFASLLKEVTLLVFDLEPKTFFLPEVERKFKTTTDKAGLNSPLLLGSQYFVEMRGRSANDILRCLKTLLEACGLEDELYIKFV
jgi:uncharacterized protein with ParB-like and HNH nuclease domain